MPTFSHIYLPVIHKERDADLSTHGRYRHNVSVVSLQHGREEFFHGLRQNIKTRFHVLHG